MHILFCVNNIKFGTKCFVKVEQFVLPFILKGELQRVKDFARLSENPAFAYTELEEITNYYNLSIF